MAMLSKRIVAVLMGLFILCFLPVNVLANDTSVTIEENDASITYSGSWNRYWDSHDSGGYHKEIGTKDASASYTFTGTGIKWIGITSSSAGIAEVWLDSVKETTIDLYSPITTYQQLIFQKNHLDAGSHTLEIRVTGNKNPNSSGSTVYLDALKMISSDDKVPPTQPLTPRTANSSQTVELFWQSNGDTDLEGYNVYRSIAIDTGFTKVNPWVIKGPTTYVDTTVSNGVTYYYRVTALDQSGNESLASPVVSALPALYSGNYEEDAVGIAYGGTWYRYWDAQTSGGYYRVNSTTGNTVDFSFYGTGIKWTALKSTSGGNAEVILDGEAAETINLYNNGTQYQQKVYEKTGLSEGTHSLKITVKSGSIYFDALEIVGSIEERARVEENSVTVDYSGLWDQVLGSGYSGGRILETRRAGATASYTFYGTGVEWLASSYTNKGIAKVSLYDSNGASVDGDNPVLVDLYNNQQRVYKRHGLPLGKYTLKIEVTGSKAASSGDSLVNIDALEVSSPIKGAPQVPSNVTTVPGNGQITVNWTAPGPEVVGYQIYRNRGMINEGIINRGLVRGESYTDSGLIPGVEYTYQIKAIGGLGDESDFSTAQTAVPGELGLGTPAPTGTPGVGIYQENNAAISYTGNWSRYYDSKANEGYYNFTNTEGATASFSFEGTGIKWNAYRDGNSTSQVEVRVDGNLEGVINLWNASLEYQQMVFERTHLAKGLHTLQLKVLRGNVNLDTLKVLDVEDNTAPIISTGLSVEKGNTTVNLSWDANTESDLQSYRVYRSTAPDQGFLPLGNNAYHRLPATATPTYLDTSLLNGTTYYYTVTAMDEAGNESLPLTPVVSVTPVAGVGVHQEDDLGIVYSGTWNRYWDSKSNGGYYKYNSTVGDTASLTFEGTGIRWITWSATDGGQTEVVIKDQAGTIVKSATVNLWSSSSVAQFVAYRAVGLPNGVYTITIKNTSPSSNKSFWVDAFEVMYSEDIQAPEAPAALTASAVSQAVELQWSNSIASDLEGYLIYRATDPNGTFTQINANTLSGHTTYVDSTVSNGVTYYYRVTALDQSGNESLASPVVSALPALYSGNYEEDAVGIAYGGTWYRYWDGQTSGGYYRVNSTTGNTVDLSFYGTGIKWTALKSTSGGNAEVILDGEAAETINLYNNGTQYQQKVYEKTGLSEGTHSLKITVKSGSIYFDALEIVGSIEERARVEENSVTVDYSGLWDQVLGSGYSGGRILETRRAGATASYTFYGTGVEWLASSYTNKGIAKVSLYDSNGASVDGDNPVLVDLYNNQQRVYKRHGLPLGKYTLKIEVTGSKAASSGDSLVNIDALEVSSPIKGAPQVPSNVTTVPGNGQITVNWTAPGPEVVGYQIYRNRGMINEGIINRGLVRGESYTDSGLIPGVEYTYQIKAIGGLGDESDFSTAQTAVPGELGLGTPAPTGTPGVGIYQENNAAISYTGNWSRYYDSKANEGYYNFTNTEGATASFSFEGTGIKWNAYRDGNSTSQVEVRVDGNLEGVINLWNASLEYQQMVFERTHLAKGLHTLQLKVLRGNVNLDTLKVLDVEDNTAPIISTGLSVEKGNTTVNLSWDANTESDLQSYRVYRSTAPDQGFLPLGNNAYHRLPATATPTYLDTSLLNGTTYYYTVTAVDEAGNESLPLTPVVSVTPAVGVGVHQEDDLGLLYSGNWYRYWNDKFNGGYYKVSSTLGNTASLVFEGTGIRWFGLYSTSGSKVEIYLDDSLVDTVDLYRPQTDYQTIAWQNPSPLSYGFHTLTIKNISSKDVVIDAIEIIQQSDLTPPNPPTGLSVLREGGNNYLQWVRSQDADLYGYYVQRSPSGQEGTFERITKDPLRYGSTYYETVSSPVYYQVTAVDLAGNESQPTSIVADMPAASSNGVVEENNSVIAYTGVWNRGQDVAASGGYLMNSSDSGLKVNYTWYGTGIDWLAQTNSSSGIAQVLVDGKEPVLVDLFSRSASSQRAVYRLRGLSLGQHTLELSYFDKNINSGGNTINVDAFKVVESDLAVPPAPSVAAIGLVNKVRLTWNQPSSQDILGYNVYYRNDVFQLRKANLAGLVQSGFLHTGLNLSTRYYYVVTSVDTLGNESTVSSEVYAETAESLIKAVLESSYEAVRGQAVTFNANSSYSADPPLTYEWDLNGDGVYDDALGSEASWTYQTAGNYTIGLKVTDSLNRTDATTATVNVRIAVTGITLNKDILNLEKGAKETILATVVPADAPDTSVIWSSNNPAVATVTSNGEVSGIDLGSATITAKTTDGSYVVTCTVTVVKPVVVVTGVTLDQGTLRLNVNHVATLTAIVLPTDASNKELSWSTGDSNIAIVNQSGVVTAVGPGACDITVTTVDGEFTATSTVTVVADTLPPIITNIQPQNGVSVGGPTFQRMMVYVEDNEGSAGATASMDYSQDGLNWVPVASTVQGPNGTSPFNFYADWDLHSLSSGTYSVRYSVYDGAGNSVQQMATYQVDRTAPQAPSNLISTSNPGRIDLVWEMPVDADVDYYQLYRAEANGSLVFLQRISGRTTVSYSDTTGIEGVEYRYEVTAVDKYGQEGTASNITTAMAITDNVPPVILGIEQQDGTLFGKLASITVRADDNLSLDNITLQYSIDGIDWMTIGIRTGQATATFQWNTEALDGDVFVRALARDKAGNLSDGNPVRTFIIDNVGPAKVTGLTQVAAVSSVLLNWDDVPDQDFAYFQVEQKDTVNGTFHSVAQVSDKRGFNVGGLSPASDYWFRVIAFDRLGNGGSPSDEIQTRTLADNVAPQVTGIYPVPGQFASLISLKGTASDNIGVSTFTFEYSTDHTIWTEISTVALQGSPSSGTASYSWDISGLDEGAYFVRGIAYDAAGNDSRASSEGNYVEYRVDHTGPSAPSGLQALADDGFVSLSWSQNSELDLAAYKVYKSTNQDGPFTVLVERLSALEYRDRNLEPEKIYYYRVSALDTAGNEGQATQVLVETLADQRAPEIISMSPSENSVLPANPVINVLASDNYNLASVTLEYQVEGDQSGNWLLIGSQSLNKSSEVSRFTWNTLGLAEGDYRVRAQATDQAGNQSIARILPYRLNLLPPSKPELTASPRGWGADLSWTANHEPDFAGYRLYRSTISGSSYQLIRETLTTSFTDAPLAPGHTYYYVIEALDSYRNAVKSVEVSVTPTAADPYPPQAEAGNSQTAVIGMEVSFDGSLSHDNDRIASYEWDFGDGSAKATVAQPVHVYQSEGAYTVTLAVYDPTGNVGLDTTQVTVRAPQQVGTLKVTVIDDGSGAALPGASVVIQFPDGTLENSTANSQGLATIVGSPGVYKIYAYLNGFKPAAVESSLIVNSLTSTTVRLQRGELVVGELTVKRMTLDEVKAAGVDVNASENQWVYNFEVHLAFNNQPAGTASYMVNGVGGFLGSTWQPLVIQNPPDPNQPVGGNAGTLIAYPAAIPHPGHPEVRPTIAYLVIPGEARWLKEFFEVGLTLENTAEQEFVITDSQATLRLPSGLALAPTNEPQSLTVDLGAIAGGERRETKWIIRGDQKGMYTLEAEFSGRLQPFNDLVKTVFNTREPFRVWGDDALKMHIDTQNRADQGYPYNARFGLENVSDIPVYNASIELIDAGKQNFIYAPNQELTKSITELKPGETVWADVQLIPSISGMLDLTQSYVLKTGGNATVQADITSHVVPENQPGTAPSLQQTQNGDGTVTLSWDQVPNALKYWIYTVRDDLTMSGTSEMVYEALASESSVTLSEINGPKDYILTTIMPDGELLRHAITGLSWSNQAGAMVITVNPQQIIAGQESELWITVNKDGFPVAGGTVDVGSYAQGVVLDENGQAKVKVNPSSAGQILVTAYTPDHQVSVSTHVTVLGASLAAPTVNPVYDTNTVVTGMATPNTTVIVMNGSTEIGTDLTAADGTFSVNIPFQTLDTVLTVFVKDTSGVESPKITVTVIENIVVGVEGISATPIVKIGINPDDGGAGIFVGLKEIKDSNGNIIQDALLANYQIEVYYDQERATVLAVYDVAHLGQFVLNKGENQITVTDAVYHPTVTDAVYQTTVTDTVYQGISNFEKLFFVPLALTGSSNTPTNVTIKFTRISDTNLNLIRIPDVTLTFQRGKIYNEASNQSLSIVDAIAGLKYLSNIIDVGSSPGQVNVVNMASILVPEEEATSLKPSIKDIIALMQKLVGLRDENFQLVSQS